MSLNTQSYIKNIWSSIYTEIINYLAPWTCAGCKIEGAEMCSNCIQAIKSLKPGGKIFSDLSAWYAWPYHHDKIKQLIESFKFDPRPDLARFIPELICSLPSFKAKTYLCPIPLHPERQAERGFNQSQLIAEAFSQITGLPIYSGLVRIKKTLQQAKMKNAQARVNNVSVAFKLKKIIPNDCWKIILVDDVVTTGSTLLSAKQAFPAKMKIDAWCLAG